MLHPQPKPDRCSTLKKRKERQHRLTRFQVRQLVFRREHGQCQRCGRLVTDDCWPWEDRRAHVNEIVPRSLGGDPLDPDNCELTCRPCHLPHGQHAPTQSRMERLLELSARAKAMKKAAKA